MAEYLSPGVYVEEFESGPKPMEGVSTSTVGFVGVAERGPVIGQPILVTNYSDFYRKFGGYLSGREFGDYRFLPYAVEQFFVNGGSRCYIMRVAPEDAKSSVSNSQYLKFKAKNPGKWGNKLRIELSDAKGSKTQILEEKEINNKIAYKFKSTAGFYVGDIVKITRNDTYEINKIASIVDGYVEFTNEVKDSLIDTELVPSIFVESSNLDMAVYYEERVENYENLSINPNSMNYIEKKIAKSELIMLSIDANDEIKTPFNLVTGKDDGKETFYFSEGYDGSISSLNSGDFMGEDRGPSRRKGINSFLENNEVSIMSVPGIVDLNVQKSLIDHCENMGNRFAILDIPKDSIAVGDVLKHRDVFDSNFASMYHPWIRVFDHLDKHNVSVPPSGAIAGIFARSDQERGVHKAPANEIVRNAVDLDCKYNEGEQDILNPKGVNLIRSFSGSGIRVWGARTISSDTLWKYINVRRLFIFIEESIRNNTRWVVFEPNDELLWVRVKRTIEIFLEGVWQSGALAGSTASEAFYVNIGRNTMSEDDIANGRLVCEIGVAPVKPAEFVVFRITQKTSE